MIARVWLDDHGVVRLSGTDRLSWLQGQVTQDVSDMSPGDAKEACFVRPTGQMEAYAHVFARTDHVLLVVDKPEVALARVRDFVILEDVTAHLVSQGVWRALSGPGELLEPDGPVVMDLPIVSREEYELQTLETGVPLPGLDYGERTLLPELGPAFVSRTVSYTKGCYTGQEVLMRIHSRGHTNKMWVTMMLDGAATVGDQVSLEGDPAGMVTRSAYSPGLGHLAAAMVANRAADAMTRLQVGSTAGVVR